MAAEEVVVSDPEGNGVIGALKVVIAAGIAVRSFKSTVEALDHLLEGAEFFRNGIIVGQAYDLGNDKSEGLTEFQGKLLCGKQVGRVTVSDKAELLRKLLCFVNKNSSKSEGKFPIFRLGIPHYPKET